MGATADLVRRMLDLYNDGTPESYGSDDFLQLYAEDVDWSEAPTSIFPQGRGGDLRALREGTAWARSALRNRRMSIDEIVEDGDRAVWTGTYEATVGVDGMPLPKGTRLAMRLAMLIEARGGRIVRQRDFPAWP